MRVASISLLPLVVPMGRLNPCLGECYDGSLRQLLRLTVRPTVSAEARGLSSLFFV